MNRAMLKVLLFLIVVLQGCNNCEKNLNSEMEKDIHSIILNLENNTSFLNYKIGPVERRKDKILFREPNDSIWYVRNFNPDKPESLECVNINGCNDLYFIHGKLKELTNLNLLAVTTEEGILYYYTKVNNSCYRYIIAQANQSSDTIKMKNFYDNKDKNLLKLERNWYLINSTSFLEYDKLP